MDATLGFRLLAHAEIEACMEDLVKDTLSSCRSRYLTTRKPSIAAMSLCGFYGGDVKLEGLSVSSAEPLDTVLMGAITRHHREVAANHGIKEANVLNLVLPIGVRLGELDPYWLAAMNSYGGKRGDAAHRSLGAQQLPDPEQERLDVTELVDGLVQVDRLLARLKSA